MLPEAVHDGEEQVDVVADGQPDQQSVEHGVHRTRKQHRNREAVAQEAHLRVPKKRSVLPHIQNDDLFKAA